MAKENAGRGGAAGRFAASVGIIVAADAVISMAHGAGIYVGEKYKAWRKRRDDRLRREARKGKKKKKKKKKNGPGRSSKKTSKKKKTTKKKAKLK